MPAPVSPPVACKLPSPSMVSVVNSVICTPALVYPASRVLSPISVRVRCESICVSLSSFSSSGLCSSASPDMDTLSSVMAAVAFSAIAMRRLTGLSALIVPVTAISAPSPTHKTVPFTSQQPCTSGSAAEVPTGVPSLHSPVDRSNVAMGAACVTSGAGANIKSMAAQSSHASVLDNLFTTIVLP